jgi:hypothetical protein
MLEDSLINDLNTIHYFESFQLTRKDSGDSVPAGEAAPKLKGHVIIESNGEFEPSAFLSYLLTINNRPAVFLQAEKCSKSITEIIRIKMKGVPKDVHFLKKLIYSGAMDIYIAGLHKVNSDSRADIIQFMKSNPKTNIMIGTQHIRWKPPAASEIYVLNPPGKNPGKKKPGENNKA